MRFPRRYLTDVANGGGTAFHAGLPDEVVVTPKKGRLLVFYNCEETSARRHPRSVHAGLPVIQGEKWIANLWFRGSPYEAASAKTLLRKREENKS